MAIVLSAKSNSLKYQIELENAEICLDLLKLYYSWILQHRYSFNIMERSKYGNSITKHALSAQILWLDFPGFEDTANREDTEFRNPKQEILNYQYTQISNEEWNNLLKRCIDHIKVIDTTKDILTTDKIVYSDFYNTYTKEKGAENINLRLSDFIDSIPINGQIRCKLFLHSINTNIRGLFDWIKIEHNFYTQITKIAQLKMRDYNPISVSIVSQKPNKSIFAFNMEQNNESIITQWIEIQVKYDNNKKYKYSFDIQIFMSKMSATSLKLSEKHKLKPQYISIKLHEIREYILNETVKDLYNVLLPLDILSIIFDEYYPNYFDIYGEPFIYDTLQLKNTHSLLQTTDKNFVKEAFIMTQNKQFFCNINGIGIQMSINEDYTYHNDFLNSYGIDHSNLTAIWPFNASKLIELNEMRSHLIVGHGAVAKAELLLDANISENDKFMLWVKENKRYKKHRRERYLDQRLSWFGFTLFDMNGMFLESTEFEMEKQRIAKIRACKQRCKRLYATKYKYKKHKKYNNNNKYRYHRW